MCYSKEVSLLAGSTITGFSGYLWWVYIKNGGRKIAKELSLKVPYFKNCVLAYLCIAGHQLFEYLAILTGSQLVYKTGLTISMSLNYFALRALEKLTKFYYGSRLAAFIIFLTWVEMLRRHMDFQNQHFWVRGYSHLPWGAAWLFVWFYFISASIFTALKAKSKNNRRVGLWTVLFVNATLILSIIYAYISTLFKFEVISSNCMADIFCSFDMINDFASIWCVIAALQGPFLIMMLEKTKKNYNVNVGYNIREITWAHRTLFAVSSLGVLFILYKFVPIVFGVGWKMVSL